MAPIHATRRQPGNRTAAERLDRPDAAPDQQAGAQAHSQDRQGEQGNRQEPARQRHLLAPPAVEQPGRQHAEGNDHRQHIVRQLGRGGAEKNEIRDDPRQKETMRGAPIRVSDRRREAAQRAVLSRTGNLEVRARLAASRWRSAAATANQSVPPMNTDHGAVPARITTG